MSNKRQEQKPIQERVKTTVYFDQRQVILLEELRIKRLKETHRKTTLTELVREAVDLLLDAYHDKPSN